MDLRHAADGPRRRRTLHPARDPIDDRLAAGEVLLEARYFSVDPYMRVQQHTRRTYDAPHPLGIVQQGGAVSQVLASSSAALKPGDWVLGYNGWQTYDKCHASQLQKLDPAAAPVTTALGILGMPGRTAWFGLMEAGGRALATRSWCRVLQARSARWWRSSASAPAAA